MTEQCLALTLSHWEKILGFVLYMIFEAWLGRTNKVHAASTLDLVKNSVGVAGTKIKNAINNTGANDEKS